MRSINAPVYHVPFDTDKCEVNVVQGYDGPYGHWKEEGKWGRDLRFAVDFAVPVGTIIRAVREGVVCGMWMGFEKFCETNDPQFGKEMMSKTNFVVMEHRDGTRTIISHLMSNSNLVKIGEMVQESQPIARSGLSGWVGDIPNIHVDARQSVGKIFHTFPIKFAEIDYPLDHQSVMEMREEKEFTYCPHG